MSSFVRNIERAAPRLQQIGTRLDKHGEPYPVMGRGVHFMGRGYRLGVFNPKAKDLLARLTREAKRVTANG